MMSHKLSFEKQYSYYAYVGLC